MRVLIVEDARRPAAMLTQIMVEQKRSAEAVRDGEDGFAYAMSGLHDAAAPDVMRRRRTALRWRGSCAGRNL